MNERLRGLVDAVKDLPPVKAYRVARFDRAFARTTPVQLHRGIYASFSEALRHSPGSLPIGYDNSAAASLYAERHQQVYPSDYPVLFWMRTVWGDVRRVFDLGGHLGIAFYAYRRLLPYASDLSWTVLDVPAVVERGDRLARERGETQLSFTEDLGAMSGADVLLAAGSLQFIEEPLSAMLERVRERPRHIIVNRTPITDGRPFVTLHNNGAVICPYNVFNREELVASLGQLGYGLVDTWKNWQPGLACFVAFHPERSVPEYSGMYFRLR
nr:hypothetical protein Hi04_10k_c2441A_00021 [uncultured bacterium]UXE44486.1 hypothetical protein Hi04_10k_c2441B_00034 [uncultured bacterium]